MFYDEYCETDNQKVVFKSILELSKKGYISIQELDYLNIPENELKAILSYFETKGLFKNVQHFGQSFPVIFLL